MEVAGMQAERYVKGCRTQGPPRAIRDNPEPPRPMLGRLGIRAYGWGWDRRFSRGLTPGLGV